MIKRIRVLMAKPGLDGHDRGIKVVARALRDAGMEIIYTGLHQTPQQIVAAAIQEDVDVVGLSILSGAHMTLFPKIRKLLDDNDGANILLIGGGTIDKEDAKELLQNNFAVALFASGTPTDHIIEWINEKVV